MFVGAWRFLFGDHEMYLIKQHSKSSPAMTISMNTLDILHPSLELELQLKLELLISDRQKVNSIHQYANHLNYNSNILLVN